MRIESYTLISQFNVRTIEEKYIDDNARFQLVGNIGYIHS